MHPHVGRDLPLLRQLDHARAARSAESRMTGVSARLFCSHRLNIRWRSPTSFICNLWVCRRVGLIQSEFTARSSACSFGGTCILEQLDMGQGAENVVTLGMRCCHLLWVGSARGSRRALRTHSPRILCRCSVLRNQIFGLRRRDVGAKPRGHRCRDRSSVALSQKSAVSNRTGRSLDGAVMRLTGPPQDAPKGRA